MSVAVLVSAITIVTIVSVAAYAIAQLKYGATRKIDIIDAQLQALSNKIKDIPMDDLSGLRDEIKSLKAKVAFR
jgi:membrane protein insertase Oxa1/YidC/SpoIIIJ